ncbi:aminoglycoside phosphotransferase family protein [Anoxynatronum buryatiense]|uniref:Phosphotransferase enzyme family protein n=1 Tax=Anoxynatronum buryatiense TaxID=489973 RepID=A0AA45WYG9_9CLOT|nr:aminoglycoside phosphotransferase family protein [Anoxynatronum buryatiense]SMP68574.1 Phosphotransferase enzyme family protein [Anoxynatronum buryatiense]
MKHGKIIGIGNTATVYELKEGKVLKLFGTGYPLKAVEREFFNAKAIRHMIFAKPHAYEIVFYEEQMGIIYDKVEGESLLDWVIKTGDVEKCAVYMAEIHKSIGRNEISTVPNYKEFLEYHIVKGLPDHLETRKKALQMLEKLGDGNRLCHGDFHPGNLFLSNGQIVVIDFMNLCHGDFLYDVAKTVFLLEYTPVPAGMENKEIVYQLKKTLADLYLIQMNVTRDMIQDYLSVISTARVGECPNEQLNEAIKPRCPAADGVRRS